MIVEDQETPVIYSAAFQSSFFEHDANYQTEKAVSPVLGLGQ
jgi:hypothetical protein